MLMKKWKQALAEAEGRYILILRELEKEHYQVYSEGLENALATVRNEIQKLESMSTFEKIRF